MWAYHILNHSSFKTFIVLVNLVIPCQGNAFFFPFMIFHLGVVFCLFLSTELTQSRSQSLVPFDQRSENESSGSNHFEITKEITEFWLSGSLRICIYGACLKWLLPELSIPAAGQKDRRLWGREWN